MKKLLFTLLLGMTLCPMTMDAKIYKVKHGNERPDYPIMAPARYQIGVYVDEETGDLYISPNYDIAGLQITLAGNGVTYLDTTVTLAAGQVYTDSIDNLDEGSYTLTLKNGDGDVIAQYAITVEED